MAHDDRRRRFFAFLNFFVAAMLLYAALTLLWVWILTFTPLSYAYPFAALAFGMTPLLAAAVAEKEPTVPVTWKPFW